MRLRSVRGPLPPMAIAAATCAALVAASVAWVDRPVATWVHEHLESARLAWFAATYAGRSREVGPFDLMASPAEALGPLATLGFAALAIAACAGWRPAVRGRSVLALDISVFAVMEVNGVAKSVCGRTWPESWLGDNPSWIRDGVFGFSPFHSGPGWSSFPSGHTAVVATFATVLWLVWPELRAVWAALVAIVAVGLVGANTHFVSDVIGGLYLGVAVGLGCAGLMLSPSDRLFATR